MSNFNGCTRPKFAIVCGTTDNGKAKLRFLDFKDRSLYDPRLYPQILEIPCGKCPSCKLRYAREWSDRCISETFYHDQNYFVTLTYDDEHIPKNEKGTYTLRKSHMSQFMKNLRQALFRKYGERVEVLFFGCGEYGSLYHRPHLHLLLFGLPLDDLVFVEWHNGKPLYDSEFLEKIWQKGFVRVGYVTKKSANYVARYTYKKAFQDDTLFYQSFDIEPEFVNMSRRPAIGRKFFEDHYEFLFDNMSYPFGTEDGGEKIFTTKYWKKLLEKTDPVRYNSYIRDAMASMLNKKEILFNNHDKPYLDILSDVEREVTDKTKIFKERKESNVSFRHESKGRQALFQENRNVDEKD